MPIIEKPKPNFTQIANDPGLEYLESQRWWSHRVPSDLKRVMKFYHEVQRNPGAIERCKTYPFSERIPLKPAFDRLNVSYLEILKKRKTHRELGSAPVNFEDLSTWLMASFGHQSHLTEVSKDRVHSRTTPGPGGLFPSEIYYLSINTEGLKRGIYHFQPEEAVLEVLPWDVENDTLKKCIPGEDVAQVIDQASGLFFVTSVFQRLRVKYGNRYLRFALLEAGCIYQNMDLCSNALNLKIWPQGSGDEESMRKILRIDGVTEAVVHKGILVGRE